MAIITVTVVESEKKLVEGIPFMVDIETSIPCTVFYTLDGSDPNSFSYIYVEPIILPERPTVVLKILATNGIDSSGIITKTYNTNVLQNSRLSHSATDAQVNAPAPTLKFPFGTEPIQQNIQFLNPGISGKTVYDPNLPGYSTGYDGNGNPTGFANQPYSLENYSIYYSETNQRGETGKGIGTLPAHVTIQRESPPPEETKEYTSLFDPRAMVIFQDVANEKPGDPAHINRMFFSLENVKTRDGCYFYNMGLENQCPSGSFVKQYFNPRDNSLTHYYYDNKANKWIISKAPYEPGVSLDLSVKFVSKGQGAGFVFQWLPVTRRFLY